MLLAVDNPSPSPRQFLSLDYQVIHSIQIEVQFLKIKKKTFFSSDKFVKSLIAMCFVVVRFGSRNCVCSCERIVLALPEHLYIKSDQVIISCEKQ